MYAETGELDTTINPQDDNESSRISLEKKPKTIDDIPFQETLSARRAELSSRLEEVSELPEEERLVVEQAIQSEHYAVLTRQWMGIPEGENLPAKTVLNKLQQISEESGDASILHDVLSRDGKSSNEQIRQLHEEITEAARSVVEKFLKKTDADTSTTEMLQELVAILELDPQTLTMLDREALVELLAEQVDFEVVLREMIGQRQAEEYPRTEEQEETSGLTHTTEDTSESKKKTSFWHQQYKRLSEIEQLLAIDSKNFSEALNMSSLINLIFDRQGHSSGGMFTSSAETGISPESEQWFMGLLKDMISDDEKKKKFFATLLPDSENWQDDLRSQFRDLNQDGLVSSAHKKEEFKTFFVQVLKIVSPTEYSGIREEHIVLTSEIEEFLVEEAGKAYQDSQDDDKIVA